MTLLSCLAIWFIAGLIISLALGRWLHDVNERDQHIDR